MWQGGWTAAASEAEALVILTGAAPLCVKGQAEADVKRLGERVAGWMDSCCL